MFFLRVNLKLKKFTYSTSNKDLYNENVSFTDFEERELYYVLRSLDYNGCFYRFPKNITLLKMEELKYKPIHEQEL